MTQEQQKGNKIIAAYDGWQFLRNDEAGRYIYLRNNRKIYDFNFAYHSDWNVLIEVWAKVYQELLELRESGKITEQDYLDLCCDCEDGFNMGKIEDSFSVTVQAIKVINTFKKKQENENRAI